ncbi:uncharacterized protein TNCV_3646251 [Trichonephila clavipes]|nr:uncharacterized protein TNCV_3646251 [Trichonephila clavipes]
MAVAANSNHETQKIGLSFEHNAGDSTSLLGPSPNLEGEIHRGGQGPPTSLPLPPTSGEDLQLNRYLEYHHAAKTLYIYKHPCLLRDSNPVPMDRSHRC